MSKKQNLIIGVIAAMALAGCGSGGSADMGGASRASAASTAFSATLATNPQAAKPPTSLPRKVIYKGSIDLVADNLDVAASKLEAKVKQIGGYVAEGNKAGDKGTIRTATWTVRIPSEKFDEFVNYVSELGELQSNKRESQDVSEEFYDVAARLKNKKVEESRLIELLKQSRNQLSDVLTLEKELTRVREECEQIEGRLKFLANQTDLSTISITMREAKEFKPETSPTVQTQVGRTWTGSLDTLKQLGVGILLMIVAIAPWLVPFGLLAGIIMLIVKKATPKPIVRPPVQNREEPNIEG